MSNCRHTVTDDGVAVMLDVEMEDTELRTERERDTVSIGTIRHLKCAF